MNRRAGLRDRWRDEHVIPHPDIGDACKLLLLIYATRMTDKGYLAGLRRDDIADMLGVHPRRIAERTQRAIAYGLLDKIGGGYHGRTAEYAAVIPTLKGDAERTLKGDAERTHRGPKGAGERTHNPSPFEQAKGDAQRHPNTRASSNATKNEGRSDGESATGPGRRCRLCGQPSGKYDEHVDCLRDEVARARTEAAS